MKDSKTALQINKPKALMLASVASMIDLFNAENIDILEDIGCYIEVAANFQEGSITSQQRVDEYKNELLQRGIVVHDVPIPRNIFQLTSIIHSYQIIKKLVNERHYRIVHCHSPIGGVLARLACRQARANGTNVIYTGHGLQFFKGAPLKNWMLFYPIERLCANITDIIIAINQEDYQRELSWKACKVEYVPGIGVDTKAFQNCVVDRDAMRKSFGFEDNDFVFMSTGQISVRKNHEVIIKALEKVNDSHIKYLIVGFGELEDKLKILTKELGLENRVVFAGYRGDVKELLHCVEGFAFPSLQEGLPVALMEAMAVGLPIVCSRIRGNVDLIEDGKGGYLYDCHDVEGFARGMMKIASSDSRVMGEMNKNTMKHYDKSVVNSSMLRIYKSIVDEK